MLNQKIVIKNVQNTKILLSYTSHVKYVIKHLQAQEKNNNTENIESHNIYNNLSRFIVGKGADSEAWWVFLCLFLPNV